ncbi:MAG: NAD(P)H-binding protein [Caldimonas sp.]
MALVAGATGLIGRALLSRLLDDALYERIEVLARRPLPADVARHERLTVHIGDASTLAGATAGVTDVFIALGTTIKVAGSQAAFKAIDHDLVVTVARAARSAGATRIGVVSALGADAKSSVFYNRVKGEMETDIASLGFASVTFAQPSLLLGDRAALGQPERRIERLAMKLGAPLSLLIPRSVRPIRADAVAASLVAALAKARPGIQRLSSGEMQSRRT